MTAIPSSAAGPMATPRQAPAAPPPGERATRASSGSGAVASARPRSSGDRWAMGATVAGIVYTRVTGSRQLSDTLRRMPLPDEVEYVLRTIEERGIRYIRLWFTDVLGFLKAFTITSQELEGAFAEGG